MPHQEPGRPQRVGIGRGEFIRREHLANHLVVGFVGGEGIDDPVAPAPDIRLALTDFVGVAIPVAVPPDIHPVPGPALGVLGPGEQLVDHPLVGGGRVIGQKRIEFSAGRRQAEQIERHPSQQHLFGRESDRRHPGRLLTSPNERIDRVRTPLGGIDLRQLGPTHGLERPVFVRVFRNRLVGPRCPSGNPLFDEGDLVRLERPTFRRHQRDAVTALDRLNQQTPVHISGHDSRPAGTAFSNQLDGIQTQVVLLLERPMTIDAAALKDRVNLLGKADFVCGACGDGPGGQPARKRHQQRADHPPTDPLGPIKRHRTPHIESPDKSKLPDASYHAARRQREECATRFAWGSFCSPPRYKGTKARQVQQCASDAIEIH